MTERAPSLTRVPTNSDIWINPPMSESGHSRQFGFVRFRGIVSQNYFQHPGAKDRFKIALPTAT